MRSAAANLQTACALAALAAIFGGLLHGCAPTPAEPPPGDEAAGAETSPAAGTMEDVTEAVGLDFTHQSGMTGELYFSEMMGAGGALFDADGDGDLDVYLVQGGPLQPGMARDPEVGDRLYRNDLDRAAAGADRVRLVDVTAESGLAATGYGMGVATGDVDNDGRVDLYLANFGPNQLWHNQGTGPDGHVTFRDVTAAAGVDDDRWSTSAAFLDYDGDGWLDLYVVNYTTFRLSNHKPCAIPSGRREYCGPQSYEPETDRLFRNLGGERAPGDATPRFADVSAETGILDVPGAGLGVVTGDFDDDGAIDLYVANDQDRNRLWIRDGDGRFVDRGLLSGSATNLEGKAESSMGVDAGDFDADGDEDLFMTHIDAETNTLFVNDGQGVFRDATFETRLGPASIGLTGFGTAFFDLGLDGWLDLAVVNGAVYLLNERREVSAPGGGSPLRQPNQLFVNVVAEGGSRRVFADASDQPPWTTSETSRGLAVGDVDDDGDEDLLVTNNDGPARLLLNRRDPAADEWLGLRLVDPRGPRDALGARVVLRRRGATDLMRRVRTDGSYLSARDPRVLFGLAAGGDALAVEVRWADGSEERWPAPPPGRYTTLVRGEGTALGDDGAAP